MGGIMFSLKYRQSRSHLSTLLSAIHISALKDNCLFRWRLSPSIANSGVCPWWEALILLPTHITRHSNPSGWLESVWNREALSQMIEGKRKTNGNIKPRLHKHRPNQWSPSMTLLTSFKKQNLCAHIRGDIWKQPQCLMNCSELLLTCCLQSSSHLRDILLLDCVSPLVSPLWDSPARAPCPFVICWKGLTSSKSPSFWRSRFGSEKKKKWIQSHTHTHKKNIV